MWADSESAVDLLNVQHIVAAVLSVVRERRLPSITAGVYGDWGSGKSSVIRMVQADLDADPDTLCVYFNGWLFEGYEDAKVALATTILEAVEAQIDAAGGKLAAATPAKPLIRRLLDRVDRLRVTKALTGAGINAAIAASTVGAAGLTGHAGVAIPVVLGAAAASLMNDAKKIDGAAITGLFKEQEQAAQDDQRETRHAVRDFAADFKALVAQLPLTRLVVVVDDLDRCLPRNVIETFEAIRLFLSAPNTAFVIAADEGVMRYAVSQQYPAYEEDALDGSGRRKIDIGGRYLEKFVQVPVRIPPLSPGDLHGYLNLLFAEKHAPDTEAFPAFCARVREATGYNQVAFRIDDAERLLGAPPSEALKADLALAEQIAPVLAASAEGNPRQTKRFLNALLLRMEMAKARGVAVDRAVAAKLLLLEYFQPAVFTGLAQSALEQGGTASELAVLESQVRPAPAPASPAVTPASATKPDAAPAPSRPASDNGQAAAKGDGARGARGAGAAAAADAPSALPANGDASKRASGRVSDGTGGRPALPPALPAYTVGLIENPKVRAWLAAEPQIGATDLRPYIYFAAQRFLMAAPGDQRLSATGQEALADLLAPSETFHVRAAGHLGSLQGPEVSVIIASLAQAARRATAETLVERTSPLYALLRVADTRPGAAGEVLGAVVNLPADILPASVAVRVGELAKHDAARAVAVQVLERWSQQTQNIPLQKAAIRRLQTTGSAPTLTAAR